MKTGPKQVLFRSNFDHLTFSKKFNNIFVKKSLFFTVGIDKMSLQKRADFL